jgi:hypothetical protein
MEPLKLRILWKPFYYSKSPFLITEIDRAIPFYVSINAVLSKLERMVVMETLKGQLKSMTRIAWPSQMPPPTHDLPGSESLSRSTLSAQSLPVTLECILLAMALSICPTSLVVGNITRF